jgi:hypothetical protein
MLQLQKLEGFKGCLRGLAINQQSQNLSGHKVGQCFPLVEQGSYFPGDAYAVYGKCHCAILQCIVALPFHSFLFYFIIFQCCWL